MAILGHDLGLPMLSMYVKHVPTAIIDERIASFMNATRHMRLISSARVTKVKKAVKAKAKVVKATLKVKKDKVFKDKVKSSKGTR